MQSNNRARYAYLPDIIRTMTTGCQKCQAFRLRLINAENTTGLIRTTALLTGTARPFR
jgi:hypothetical protein